MSEMTGGPGPEDQKPADAVSPDMRWMEPGYKAVDDYIDEDGRTRFDSPKAQEATRAMADNEALGRVAGYTKTNAEALANTEKAAPGIIASAELNDEMVNPLEMALQAGTREEAIRWLDDARAKKGLVEQGYAERTAERADAAKTKEEKLAELRRQITELETT